MILDNKINNNKKNKPLKVLMLVKKALIFSSFVGMILFVACTDVTEVIGGDFVPDLSNMNMIFTDTVTTETYSILKDSIVNSNSTPYLLGSIIDPVFGKTTASINAKFLVSLGFDSVFHAAEFFDSLVLNLSYSRHYYGDTLEEQTIHIYELEENFDDLADYYSNYVAQHSPIELAAHTFAPKPNTSVSIIEGATSSPQIKILITKSPDHPFAAKLLSINIEDYLEYDSVLDYNIIQTENFYEFFNGLNITTDPINGGLKGSLFGINLYATDTRLELYKHDTILGKTSNGLNDSAIIVNRFSSIVVNTSEGKAFNHYDHSDYLGADNLMIDQVINGNKELGQEKVYIQSLAGNQLRVKFPFIKNFKNTNTKIAINKAELVLSLAEDLELVPFDAPLYIDAQIKHLADTVSVLPDVAFGESFFGGTLDTIANEYRFRITSYVQDVLDGVNEGENGLVVFSDFENNAYSRVLLVGSNPMLPIPYSKRARLEITYTIVN